MSTSGIAVSEGFGFLLDPGLREIFWEAYNQEQSMVPALYQVGTSNKAVEYDLGIGSMGEFDEFDGRIDYDAPEQLWRISYTHVEYTKGFPIERKLFDDNLYNVINDRPKMLGMSAARSRETKGASLFNTATANTGFDGVSLGNDSHPYSATNSTDTQDNLFTLALSTGSLSTVRLAMRAWVDDRGNLAHVRPDTLLVPPELEETAYKIVSPPAGYETGSANLTPQFHAGRFKVATWDYLTDSNRWFVIDSGLMKRFLKWYDRIPLEFGEEEDFDTLIAKFRAYMRYSFGYSDWRWVAVCEPS